MSRAIATVLLLIGTSAIAAGGYVALYPVPSATNAAYDQKVAILQRIAETACRCDRRAVNKKSKADCWTELDRRLPPGGEFASACDPVSMQGRCGGTGGMIENADGTFRMDSGPCVVTGYEYFSSKGETILLCSKGEAQMVEQSWNTEALLPDAKGAVPTPLTDQLAHDLVTGKPPRPIDGPKGCTG